MPAADAAGDPIAELLAGTYLDAETGERLGTTVRAIAIGDDVAGSEAEWLAGLDLGARFAVVSDADTPRVLGARVERALAARFGVQSVVLPARPHADAETIDRLASALEPGVDALVAVGSGTLNDLCKMVGLRRGIPQVTFATAPSMNGYTSVSASITDAGFKRSVRAAAPMGVFFDLRVLAAAPVRMIRAGLGDSACRSTAQADWLLAHALLGQPYREVPFALLARDEAELFPHADALVRGDLGAMRHLVRTLVLSGFGMTLANGSFPASQGEHMLAHYVELMRPHGLPEALHGEQTGVTALVMAALQGEVLARDMPPVLGPSPLDRAAVLAHFGPVAGELCWAEFLPKRLDRAAADARNAVLAAGWDALRARIARISVGAAGLRAALAAAGGPLAPAELGWPPELVADGLRYARATRNRYTFLDLVGDAIA